MEDEKLMFKCSCGKLVEDKAEVKQNFFGAGYDIGEVRMVKVETSFNEYIGDEFWALYRPALASLNDSKKPRRFSILRWCNAVLKKYWRKTIDVHG